MSSRGLYSGWRPQLAMKYFSFQRPMRCQLGKHNQFVGFRGPIYEKLKKKILSFVKDENRICPVRFGKGFQERCLVDNRFIHLGLFLER